MTALTNLQIGASYGDVLTTTNNGQGLSNVLQPLQDGLGNNSPITIATNAVNFTRGANTFQLDGIALTASATNLNSVGGASPSFNTTGAVLLPVGNTAQRPAVPQAGMIRFNTDIPGIEYYSGAAWLTVQHL